MNIEFVPCHKDRALFICLVKDYIGALKEFDERIVWDEGIWNDAIWDSLFIVDGGVMCGFVCMREINYRSKPRLLFIDEFYISPEERRRGVGMEAVRKITRNWSGDIGLYILNRNEIGKKFWEEAENRFGWIRTERSDIRKEEGCELRLFRV